MVRLAIRCAFKIAFERRDAEIIAINSLGDAKTFAHLLKYDSAYGIYDHKVSYDDKHIIVDGHKILFLCEPDPAKLPWGKLKIDTVMEEPDPAKLPWDKLKIDTVMECTGAFRKLADAKKHLSAGARKVVLSAPAKGSGIKTVVLGVNEEVVTADDRILSNASCTTNCIVAASKPSCSASTKKSSPPMTASSPTLPALPTVLPQS